MQLRARCGTCNWCPSSYNKKWKLAYNQVIRHAVATKLERHAVACLVWDMQLGPISLDGTPSNKTKVVPVATKLEDMELFAHCGTCQVAPLPAQ